MSTDMIVDGRGLSALRGLRKWSWIWLLTHRQPAYAEIGKPCLHLTLQLGRSCVSSSCTRIIGKKFRQWAQRTTPGNRSLVSGFSNAVLQSLGSLASCSKQMRRPLLESIINSHNNHVWADETRTQHSNKASSKDFPSVSGVVLFMIF
jgi:hypothetical protein